MKRSSKAARRTTEGSPQGMFEITGVIKNWNSKRGFGFVKPYDGQQITQDVFLHITCLAKNTVVGVGAEVVCMVETSRSPGKNPEAVEVLRLEPAPTHVPPAPEPASEHPVLEEGSVKFFNSTKGFGFLETKVGDVFINNSTLERSKLRPEDLGTGIPVIVTDINRAHPKGPVATEIRLA